MADKHENPINLSARSRRNLYLSNREQIKGSPKEAPLLPEFDRLHSLKHQEYPRLHEFRLGWLCGRSYELDNPLLSESALDPPDSVVISKDVYTAWVDSVLAASARINHLESLLNALVEYPGDIIPETLDQEIERLRQREDL